MNILKKIKEENIQQFLIFITLSFLSIGLIVIISMNLELPGSKDIYIIATATSIALIFLYIFYIAKAEFGLHMKIKKALTLFKATVFAPLIFNLINLFFLILLYKFVFKKTFTLETNFLNYSLRLLIIPFTLITSYYLVLFLSHSLDTFNINFFKELKLKVKKFKNKGKAFNNIWAMNFILNPLYALVLTINSEYILIIFFLLIFIGFILFLKISPLILNPKLSFEVGCSDFKNIFISKLYFTNHQTNLNPYRIVKIDFSAFMEQVYTLEEILVLNHYHICPKIIEMQNNNSSFFYLCIPKSFNNFLSFKILIRYKDEQELSYNESFKLFLEFKQDNDYVFVSNYKVLERQHILCPIMHKELNVDSEFNYDYLVLDSFIYDQKSMEECQSILNGRLHESRKWVLHDGKYGCGKTMLDMNSIQSSGFIPIKISPWESNYDIDVLKLIYDKMKEKVKPPKFCITKSTFIYFGIILFTTSTVYNNFLKLSKPLNDSLLTFILLVTISGFLFFVFLDDLIIFKKDSTKTYQDFYVKRIAKMVKENPSIKLIIEDIDRLNQNSFYDITRVLSFINSNICFKHNCIGIISYSSDYLIKVLTNKDVLIDIQNKIIFKEIFYDYNYEKTKKDYLVKGVECLIQSRNFENIDFENIETEIKKAKFKNSINFRDVHSCLYEVITTNKTLDTKVILSIMKSVLIFPRKSNKNRLQNTIRGKSKLI